MLSGSTCLRIPPGSMSRSPVSTPISTGCVTAMIEPSVSVACRHNAASARPRTSVAVSHGLLWPAGRYPAPKLRVFVDFMAENLFAG